MALLRPQRSHGTFLRCHLSPSNKEPTRELPTLVSQRILLTFSVGPAHPSKLINQRSTCQRLPRCPSNSTQARTCARRSWPRATCPASLGIAASATCPRSSTNKAKYIYIYIYSTDRTQIATSGPEKKGKLFGIRDDNILLCGILQTQSETKETERAPWNDCAVHQELQMISLVTELLLDKKASPPATSWQNQGPKSGPPWPTCQGNEAGGRDLDRHAESKEHGKACRAMFDSNNDVGWCFRGTFSGWFKWKPNNALYGLKVEGQTMM